MQIDYDPAKRLQTLKERGLDFEDAPFVINSPDRITWIDDRNDYGEQRKITFGNLAGRLVVVVYTQRGSKTRIISMRKANERETRNYQKQLNQG